jgi:Gluconate 2-dehydrogenase subunit 3
VPALEVTPPDSVAAPVTQFFTPPQFAALRRLAGLIEPPLKGSLGALDCGVPEFLDFLIGASPSDRQQLYRGGLDALNAQAKKQFNKAFADVDDAQAHTILQPMLVAVPWATDPPKDPLKHFLFAVRVDVPMATRNSPEFAAAGANSGRRGGGGGLVWNPIDPVYRG